MQKGSQKGGRVVKLTNDGGLKTNDGYCAQSLGRSRDEREGRLCGWDSRNPRTLALARGSWLLGLTWGGE